MKSLRATARLTALSMVLVGFSCVTASVARAQAPATAPAPQAAPAQPAAGQAPAGVAPIVQYPYVDPRLAQVPMWVGPTPMYQVGPNGAVNLDQPTMGPGVQYMGYPGQPMMVGPSNATPYTVAQPTPLQPVAQPWGAPVVQQTPAWGPALPAAQSLLGGPLSPMFVHRMSVFGEFLYVRPRNAEVAYALPIDGPVAPTLGNEVPIGPTAVVDPDYDCAFRVGVNFALSQGSSLAAQYTRLRSDATHSATIVAPNVLRSLVAHPLGANAATDTLDASAGLDINYDLFDIDFRSLMYGCEHACAYSINYLIGVQYAELDQEFRSSFVTVGTTTVNSDIEFSGFGMRFGLQGERLWPTTGIFVYSTGVTNLLFGEFEASYAQANTFGGTQAFTSWEAGRIVPVVDFEIGAGCLTAGRHLRLSAGYRVSAWFNVVTTDDWIQAVQTHNFTNLDGTLTFDGLVARAEWLF